MSYSGNHKVSYLELAGGASGDPTDALATGYPRPGNPNRFIWLSVALTVIVFVVAIKVTMTASAQPPLLPSFAIASITVTSASLSTGVSSGVFSVTLAVRNPNTKVDVRFDTIAAAVYYGGAVVAEAALPPMYQPALAERFVAATATHVGSGVARGVRRDMWSGRGGDGNDVIWFRVDAACRLAFHHQVNGAEAARWRKVMVRCDDLSVRFDNTTMPLTSGKLVAPLRPCTVK
jgi:hypothetical protein